MSGEKKKQNSKKDTTGTACMTQHCGLLIAMIVLALGVAFAGVQIQSGLTNFKSSDRTVQVKGLAQRDVVADLALWPISYTETGNDLPALQDLMDMRGSLVLSFLATHGIKDAEVELQQVYVQDLLAQSYRNGNVGQNRYILTQTYLVRSDNIEAIDKASKNIGDLIRQGVAFSPNSSTAPTYLFTRLNDIKPDMIAQATKNAREAAMEFANNSGQKVGGIKRASQGVFQILPRDESYAVAEAQQKNKTVRVVSTLHFYLD